MNATTIDVRVLTDGDAPRFAGPDGTALGAREGLRRARRALGLTARELGPLLGVSGRTVEGWEQGRRVPPRSALLLLAARLDAAAPPPRRRRPPPPARP